MSKYYGSYPWKQRAIEEKFKLKKIIRQMMPNSSIYTRVLNFPVQSVICMVSNSSMFCLP